MLRRISSDPKGGWFGGNARTLLAARKAVEFDIALSRIVEFPQVQSLPNSQQPVMLQVAPGVRLAFERCFMEHSLVIGQFPASGVKIAFAVRPDGAGDDDVFDWPLSFDWIGEGSVVQSPSDAPPAIDELLPIYRYAALCRAEQLAHTP